MLSMLCVLVVSASPAPSLIASPGLQAVNVDPKVAAFVLDHLSEQLGRDGVQMLTPTQVQTMLGLERQRQLMGCDDSGCAAELGDALGASLVLVGSVAKLGGRLTLTAQVLESRTGARRAAATRTVEDEAALLEASTGVARDLASQLSPPSPRRFFVIPLVVGALAAVGTGVTWALATSAHVTLTSGAGPVLDGAARAGFGSAMQLAAGVSLGVLVASAVATVSLLTVGGNTPVTVQPTVALVSSGALFGIGGVLP